MTLFEWPCLTTSIHMNVSFVSDNARGHQQKRQSPPPVPKPEGFFRRSISLPEDGTRNHRRSTMKSRRSRRCSRRSSIDVMESVMIDNTICRWHNMKISASNDIPPVLKRRNPETSPNLKRSLVNPGSSVASILSSPLSWRNITNPTTEKSSSLSILGHVLEHMEQQNLFHDDLVKPHDDDDDDDDDDVNLTMSSTDDDTSSSSTSSFDSAWQR